MRRFAIKLSKWKGTRLTPLKHTREDASRTDEGCGEPRHKLESTSAPAARRRLRFSPCSTTAPLLSQVTFNCKRDASIFSRKMTLVIQQGPIQPIHSRRPFLASCFALSSVFAPFARKYPKMGCGSEIFPSSPRQTGVGTQRPAWQEFVCVPPCDGSASVRLRGQAGSSGLRLATTGLIGGEQDCEAWAGDSGGTVCTVRRRMLFGEARITCHNARFI